MTKVYLIQTHLLRKLRELIKLNIGKFKKGESIAIKTHMGEYGNLNYARPPIIGLIAEELKAIGARPFVFDTPTVYEGSRSTCEKYKDTARRNGFTEETIGCPIIISDEGKKSKSKYLSKIELSKKLVEADGMIVVSHFKGHENASYGGAIKNLGMGGITKESKGIMHSETQTKIENIKNCIGCGACVQVCPSNALTVKNKKICVDYNSCFGCSACMEVCKNNVFGLKTARFSRALAEAAGLVLNEFKNDKLLYINILLDISKTCDCLPIGDSDSGPIVCRNIGFLLSDDILAIDQCSLDLAERASSFSFGKLYHAKLDEQLSSGQEFKMGNRKYKLEEV